MKKLIVIIAAMLLLSGCSNKYQLKKIGYSEQDIELIELLNDENIERFLEGYNEELLKIIKNPDFKEENIDLYARYDDYFSDDILYYLVNNSLVNNENIDKIRKLMSDPYFIMERTGTYLEFYDSYQSLRKLVEAVNSYSCYEQYTYEVETDISKGFLMLSNKVYILPDGYAPDDLVTVDKKYTKHNIQLGKTCYEAYVEMYEDAAKEGLDLSINSAYRSYDLQVWTYNNFLTKDPQAVVDTYSARPGHSEHQTGLAIDIIAEGSNFGNFHLTKEAKWLEENCDKYGFILRYPADKTDVTQYKYEAWHFRYVGDDAVKIKESGLTFDEYYAFFIED